jgi:hypothetical protein
MEVALKPAIDARKVVLPTADHASRVFAEQDEARVVKERADQARKHASTVRTFLAQMHLAQDAFGPALKRAVLNMHALVQGRRDLVMPREDELFIDGQLTYWNALLPRWVPQDHPYCIHVDYGWHYPAGIQYLKEYALDQDNWPELADPMKPTPWQSLLMTDAFLGYAQAATQCAKLGFFLLRGRDASLQDPDRMLSRRYHLVRAWHPVTVQADVKSFEQDVSGIVAKTESQGQVRSNALLAVAVERKCEWSSPPLSKYQCTARMIDLSVMEWDLIKYHGLTKQQVDVCMHHLFHEPPAPVKSSSSSGCAIL